MLKQIAKSCLLCFSFNERKHLASTFSGMPDEDGLTLIDIGAAGGLEPRWKKIEKHVVYYGFEPDARALKELEKIPSDLKERTLFPVALCDSEKLLKMYMCKKSQVSSQFLPMREFLDRFPKSDRFDVEYETFLDCVTLDDLHLPSSDFIKIDVEGGELAALTGASKTLQNTFGLEVEVGFSHLHKGQPLFGDICEYLTSFGFELVDFTRILRWERYSHNGLGQSVLGDALFLKPPEYVLDKHRTITSISAYLKILLLYRRFDLIEFVLENLAATERMPFKQFERNIQPIKRSLQGARFVSSISGRLISFFGLNYKSHLIY